MSDLVAFLTARLDEDELFARRTRRNGFTFDTPATAERLHRDATRALADIAAKRQIVNHVVLWNSPERKGPGRGRIRTDPYAEGVRYGGEIVLLQLAQPYADHPDFREEWRG